MHETVTNNSACMEADLKHRVQFQNKLASVCEDMCKEVGAYPKCSQCPEFVPPDATPGVMTWDELLTRMDDLKYWGQDTIKAWTKQASALQKTAVTEKSLLDTQACDKEDLRIRAAFQNKLA